MDLAHAKYVVRYEIPRRAGATRDRMIRFVVWRLPRRMVMWAGFRIILHGTTGQWSRQEVPAPTAMDAMQRWDVPQDDNAPKVPSSPADGLVVREETLFRVGDALRRASLGRAADRSDRHCLPGPERRRAPRHLAGRRLRAALRDRQKAPGHEGLA